LLILVVLLPSATKPLAAFVAPSGVVLQRLGATCRVSSDRGRFARAA